MTKFEVGKTYRSWDAGIPAITVIRRTSQTITVNSGASEEWEMKICDNGKSEYAIDEEVPKRWRGSYIFYAERG